MKRFLSNYFDLLLVQDALRDTTNLKQCLIDTVGKQQNVMDEAVRQWIIIIIIKNVSHSNIIVDRLQGCEWIKRLRASMKVKGHQFAKLKPVGPFTKKTCFLQKPINKTGGDENARPDNDAQNRRGGNARRNVTMTDQLLEAFGHQLIRDCHDEFVGSQIKLRMMSRDLNRAAMSSATQTPHDIHPPSVFNTTQWKTVRTHLFKAHGSLYAHQEQS